MTTKSAVGRRLTTPLAAGLLITVFSGPAAAQDSVLVDASRDGGAWWFPQSGPNFDPNAPHQGKALADFLRGRGLTVTELPRPSTVTCQQLSQYHLVMAIDLCGTYSAAELTAYTAYVSNGGRLILLNDHKAQPTCDVDSLSQAFGLDFSGITRDTSITTFAPHPITAGMTNLPYMVGSLVTTAPTAASMLGFLSGTPVMGIMPFGSGQIFFIGDTNGIEGIPQPFVNNLLGFMMAGAQPASACPLTTTVAVSPATSTVGEGAGSATVSLRVTTIDGNPTAMAGSVAFATSDDSAVAGSDYTATSGTLDIPAGTANGSLLTVASVPILDDADNEGSQSFGVALSAFRNVGGAGDSRVHTITISDNEPGTESSEVYRLRHPSLGAYLFTIYPTERDEAGFRFGYLYEGRCCNWLNEMSSDGRMPLFRLFSSQAGEYFFTIYVSERDAAVAQFGYVYEGVAAYCHPESNPAAPRPWFRLRFGNKHLYTVFPEERDAAVSRYGYTYEGVSCYLPSP